MIDNSNSHVCVPLFVQTPIFESAHMTDSTKLSNHHGSPVVTRSGFDRHSTTHLLYLGVYTNKRCTIMWIKIVYHFVDSCQESRKLFILLLVKWSKHSFNLLQNYYFSFGRNLKIEPELQKYNEIIIDLIWFVLNLNIAVHLLISLYF